MNKKITGVTFIVIRPSGEILMQLRDSNYQRYPNIWCFPGGTLEPGEEPQKTVIREAKEEYNLELAPQNCKELMVKEYSFGGSAMFFVCQLGTDPKITMNEGADFQWMKINEIKKISLGWEHNAVLPALERFLQIQKGN